MKLEEFEKIAKAQFEYSLTLMCGVKNVEYSRNYDKLHNFKTGAMIDGTTPERTLLGYWKKQLTSVLDIINDLDEGKFPNFSTLHEKITDNINYLVLLKALIIERGIYSGEKKRYSTSSNTKQKAGESSSKKDC